MDGELLRTARERREMMLAFRNAVCDLHTKKFGQEKFCALANSSHTKLKKKRAEKFAFLNEAANLLLTVAAKKVLLQCVRRAPASVQH